MSTKDYLSQEVTLQSHPTVLFKLYLFEREREKNQLLHISNFPPIQYRDKVFKENKCLHNKNN